MGTQIQGKLLAILFTGLRKPFWAPVYDQIRPTLFLDKMPCGVFLDYTFGIYGVFPSLVPVM
jgi:hypothetical protein